WRGFRPVLTLAETSETDVALFKVHDGKLSLEGLGFEVRPAKDEFKAQAVVALVGDGDCVLRDCLVTLAKGARRASLALATVNDPGKVMRLDMPPARTRDQGPRLALQRCFVRGEGDLLWGRASRPCELDARNSLVALSGSLYHADVGASTRAPAAEQKA